MNLSFAPDAIEQWPLDRLQPYAKNAKMHGPEQVAKIAASMAEFGWTVPCLVADDGELIAGHGRVLAAELLGLTEAPVIVLDHLTDEQRRAYRIADNKLTELGEWDNAVLSEELQVLAAEDFDLSLIGFDDGELDALLSGLDEETDAEGEDEVPEPPEDPVSRPGDLWTLGEHRLLCGDATVVTDVEKLLGDKKADLCFCDPPYGVEYDPGWRNKTGASATKRTGWLPEVLRRSDLAALDAEADAEGQGAQVEDAVETHKTVSDVDLPAFLADDLPAEAEPMRRCARRRWRNWRNQLG